jgi:hypothetical protein
MLSAVIIIQLGESHVLVEMLERNAWVGLLLCYNAGTFILACVVVFTDSISLFSNI